MKPRITIKGRQRQMKILAHCFKHGRHTQHRELRLECELCFPDETEKEKLESENKRLKKTIEDINHEMWEICV